MTDTIDEQVQRRRKEMREDIEYAFIEYPARCEHNAQRLKSMAYRKMLDNLDKPRRLTRWQRFVLWIRG